MIAYLTKFDAIEGFNQIIDFLNGSSIKYALTVNPNIYVSCIKQFWTTVAVKKVNDVTRLKSLVDKKKVVVTKATIRDALRLDDAEGVECLPNEEIFFEVSRIGYEKPSTKLTFYKAFFLSQWKFLIHTILQCMSAKRMSWNEFSSSMAFAVICLSSGRKFNFSKYIFDSLVRNVDSPIKFYMYPCFLQLMIRKQVGDLSSHSTKYSSPALTQKVFANIRRVGKGFSKVDTPLFEGMLVAQEVGEGDADEVHIKDVNVAGVVAEALTKRVEHLELDKISQALEITKLKQRVRKLERRNKLKDAKDVAVEKFADIQGRIAESQAKIYQINLEHANKVLIMQDEEESEPIELQEVVEVGTTTKIITKVASTANDTIPAASTTITAADVQILADTTAAAPTLTAAPSRRRKGVVIRDPKESTTTSTIIHSEAKSKDNGKGILVEEPKPLKKQAQIKQDEKYARELEMDYFKGMSYDDICLIFKKKFNSNVAFLMKTKEKINEEGSRALKRLNESQEDKTTKKQKLDEEVPIVDYEIYNENNKPYYKIKRTNGSHQLYLSFLSWLQNFDREDLEALWRLVKERFATTKPKNFSNDFLLITLRVMFEKPDIHAQIWKNQRSVHGQGKVKSWKLLESYGV
nr:hypothetical protein [Tanacetum cinerariifolium]